jgi:SpoVK/Ycf46/Vps4 family AAA+-type ATPase
MKYQQNGTRIFLTDGVILDILPRHTYELVWDGKMGIFYLQEIAPYKIPKKIYGNPYKNIDRILTRFNHSNKNLGVLLCGLKGSGKTLASQIMANMSNLPVILLSKYRGLDTELSSFINSLPECVILIDEYDKKFPDMVTQEALLGVLDNPSSSKKLFILTCNHNNLNQYFINRPSRIFYNIRYSSLTQEEIEEVVDDMLTIKDHKESIMKGCKLFPDLNLDLLISILSEMNLFKLPFDDIIKEMNIISTKLRHAFLIDGKKEVFIREFTASNIAVNNLSFALDYEYYDKYGENHNLGNAILWKKSEVSEGTLYEHKHKDGLIVLLKND